MIRVEMLVLMFVRVGPAILWTLLHGPKLDRLRSALQYLSVSSYIFHNLSICSMNDFRLKKKRLATGGTFQATLSAALAIFCQGFQDAHHLLREINEAFAWPPEEPYQSHPPQAQKASGEIS